MGNVARFDLGEFIQVYGLTYFIETGCGDGNSLAYAASIRPAFVALRSCDIEPSLVRKVEHRFAADDRVRVTTERSSTFLRWVCKLLPVDQPAFFWLDAHFPGADSGLHGYADEADEATRLPLAEELQIIAKYRNGCDVIAVDDLRIYMDGPFGSGNLPANVRPACPTQRGIDFVHNIIGQSHTVTSLFEHEGYLLLLPKGKTRDA